MNSIEHENFLNHFIAFHCIKLKFLGGANWLIVLRILEGVGEGTTFPALNTCLSAWIPSKGRQKSLEISHSIKKIFYSLKNVQKLQRLFMAVLRFERDKIYSYKNKKVKLLAHVNFFSV